MSTLSKPAERLDEQRRARSVEHAVSAARALLITDPCFLALLSPSTAPAIQCAGCCSSWRRRSPAPGAPSPRPLPRRPRLQRQLQQHQRQLQQRRASPQPQQPRLPLPPPLPCCPKASTRCAPASPSTWPCSRAAVRACGQACVWAGGRAGGPGRASPAPASPARMHARTSRAADAAARARSTVCGAGRQALEWRAYFS